MKNIILIALIIASFVSCKKKGADSTPVKSTASDIGLQYEHRYKRRVYVVGSTAVNAPNTIVFHSDNSITESDSAGNNPITYTPAVTVKDGFSTSIYKNGKAIQLVYHDVTYKTMFSAADTLTIAQYLTGDIAKGNKATLGCYAYKQQTYYTFTDL